MSFWIIEQEKQLNNLSYNKSCYINVIPLNHNYHPLLTSISLIYYRNEEENKGFIFPINHNDGIGMELDLIKEFILKHPKIYVLDKKSTLHFLGDGFKGDNIIDINLLHLEDTIFKLEIPDFKQTVANYLEEAFKTHPNLNSFIPITKHYEEQEYIYTYIQYYIDKTGESTYYNVDYPWVMYCVEKNGITLDRVEFDQHYFLKSPKLSIKDNIIYTQYNLYNFTSRPTNSFNGVNFAALKKGDGTRKSFIPRDNYLFEMDMKAYHLFISAKLIGYELEGDDIHTELGKYYFDKEILTEEDYKKSKQLSFKMMNGGVYSQYKNVPFWNKLENYISSLWIKIQSDGYIELFGGRKIKLEEIIDPTPQKLYNYLIQSGETYYNILTLKKLMPYLENKDSKIILYSYDAFLIDFNNNDGKEILLNIKKIIESEGFKCNVSYGINYDNLKKVKASE